MPRISSALFTWLASEFCSDAIYETVSSKIGTDNQDGGEQLFHTIEQAYAAFTKDREFSLALRVCSPYPLPIVFTSPDYSIFYKIYLIKRFSSERDGIRMEKVFLIRNDKNCTTNLKNKIMEYWIVPKFSDFPDFVEMASITEFRSDKAETNKYRRKNLVEGFKMSEDLNEPENSEKKIAITPENFWLPKNNLLFSLRKDRFSFVLMEYPRYGRMAKTIYNEAVRLKQFLLKNNIRENRIILKACKLGECDFEVKTKYPLYPNISIIGKN